jgi:hypothetical protein
MQPLAKLGPVATIDELRLAGLTAEQAEWQVTSGRWQRPFRGVYLTFSGKVPQPLLFEAATKYAGGGSALSHGTAASLHGFFKAPGAIHLTVPYQRKVVKQPGLVVHRSQTLRAEHIIGDPPKTTVERTVLDVLDTLPDAEKALAFVAGAVRSRRTTSNRLREALVESPRTKWRKVCLEALPEVGRGAHSLLELKDGAIRKRHGLPRGKRQVRRDANGTEYLDVVIEEWRLHTELDGRLGHEEANEIWRDMRRDNSSEVLQLRHLRYGWADVVHRPCQVAIEQAIVLRQQGWRGRFKCCPDCPPKLPEEVRRVPPNRQSRSELAN